MNALLEELRAHPQVLVVCTGNICRSPMGEIILREELQRCADAPSSSDCSSDVSFDPAEITVVSAGVSTEEHGNPIYPPAARILAAHGYPVPAHRAHQATASELLASGLILAMTCGHARSLRSMCESAGVSPLRIYLWREFEGLDTSKGNVTLPLPCFAEGGYLDPARHTGRSHSCGSNFYSYNDPLDVPDPWYSGNFNETREIVEAGARGIITALGASRA